MQLVFHVVVLCCFWSVMAGPDLTIDADLLHESLQILVDSEIDSCESSCVYDGDGARSLLRFDLPIMNIGDEDFIIGDPRDSDYFEEGNCRDALEYTQFARYYVYSVGDTMNVVERNQSSCLVDADYQEDVIDQTPTYHCNYQGLTHGSLSLYPREGSCQWIDITGLDAGDYVLGVEINFADTEGDHVFLESDYMNNIMEFPFTIPDNNVASGDCSCAGRCGSSEPVSDGQGGYCYCDERCGAAGDCCTDLCDLCGDLFSDGCNPGDSDGSTCVVNASDTPASLPCVVDTRKLSNSEQPITSSYYGDIPSNAKSCFVSNGNTFDAGWFVRGYYGEESCCLRRGNVMTEGKGDNATCAFGCGDQSESVFVSAAGNASEPCATQCYVFEDSDECPYERHYSVPEYDLNVLFEFDKGDKNCFISSERIAASGWRVPTLEGSDLCCASSGMMELGLRCMVGCDEEKYFDSWVMNGQGQCLTSCYSMAN